MCEMPRLGLARASTPNLRNNADPPELQKQKTVGFWRSLRNKGTRGTPFHESACTILKPTSLHQCTTPSVPFASLPRPSSKDRVGLARTESHHHAQADDSGYGSLGSSETLPTDEPPVLPCFSWQDRLSVDTLYCSTECGLSSGLSCTQCFHTNRVKSYLGDSFDRRMTLRSTYASDLCTPIAAPMSTGKMTDKRRVSRSSKPGVNSQLLHLSHTGTKAFPDLTNKHESSSRSRNSKHGTPESSSMASSTRRTVAPTNSEKRIAGVRSQGVGSNNSLSGLVCNAHRTTGTKPPGLSGVSTTIVGDRLFVFGGQELRTRRIMRTMYELDLLRRHWTRLDTEGELPSPRYFHSMCALGETKLVLFGGSTNVTPGTSPTDKGTMPVSELHMYDIETNTWTAIRTRNSPSPRYAHCATILPSSAVFASSSAPLSALHHNPSSTNPNHGKLGVEIDGRGGAEMIVIGGQHSEEQYTDSVDIFNFRSLNWTSSDELDMHKCGAYRSVAATVPDMDVSSIGAGDSVAGGAQDGVEVEDENNDQENHLSGAPAVFYNNYNFLSPNVEVKIRHPDGSILEIDQRGQFSPPGLRFPTAGVIDHHLIVSGTFLRSSTEEYMLWALNLRTLLWHRIEIAGNIFSTGSWNRGVPWCKRNAYLVLGDRSRPFKQDYEKRRINFKNFALIELEAFGLYDNPCVRYASRDTSLTPSVEDDVSEDTVGGTALGLMEISDMEILAIDGEKIPVNSRLISRRWGPYFQHLMSEDLGSKVRKDSIGSDTASLQPSMRSGSSRNRMSNITITPTNRTSTSSASGSTLVNGMSAAATDTSSNSDQTVVNSRPLSLSKKKAVMRSRVLFLPHTYYTIRAFVHYLYTLYLPPPSHHLCTPQILCSLLQIARPYCVQGLLEATVQRLHEVLDGRNTAAIFNAAAMAAGGGVAVKLAGDPGQFVRSSEDELESRRVARESKHRHTMIEDDSETDTSLSASSSTASLSNVGSGPEREIWSGESSSVIGLQKRALRGLMEGKKARERAREDGTLSPGIGSP